MFGKRFSLFNILGFEVKLDLSWFILAILITWSLAKGFFPHYFKDLPNATYWWMGVAGTLGLFISIVLHELSHSLVARSYGIPMKGITLFIFGGVAEMDDEPPSPKTGILDTDRLEYLKEHLIAAKQAIEAGVDLRGYFAWSLLDNFEWACGFSKRFGIVHVDFGTQRRTVKNSARFYSEVIRSNGRNLGN